MPLNFLIFLFSIFKCLYIYSVLQNTAHINAKQCGVRNVHIDRPFISGKLYGVVAKLKLLRVAT